MKQIRHTLLFLFLSLQLSAQTFQLQKELIFGGTKSDKLIDVIKISNSSDLLVAGISNSNDGDLATLNPTNVSGIVLFRTDSVFNIKWKVFIPDFVDCSGIAQINSNSIAILGTKSTFKNNTIFNLSISNGSIDNSVVLPEVQPLYVHGVSQPRISFSNGILVAALNYDEEIDDYKKNIALYGFDVGFNLVWSNKIRGSADDDLHKIFTFSNRIHVWVNAYSYNFDFENKKTKTNENRQKEIWLLEFDLTTGQIVNRKSFGNNATDYIIDAEICSDGYYLLLTITGSGGDFVVKTSASSDNVICKIDFNGNVIWQKNTGSSSYSSIEVLPNQDLLISSIFAMRRFTKDGNFVFYDNTYPLINPNASSSSYTHTDNNNKTLCYYTKNVYSGVHIGNEIYLSLLKRTPKEIELETISKTWVCINENIHLKIDTNTVFNPGNKFQYKLRNVNGEIRNLGESFTTEFDFNIPDIYNLTTNVAMDYVLMVQSTNPVYQFEINNIKVQAPFSNYLQDLSALPTHYTRGTVPLVLLNYQKNYRTFPTTFTINGEKYGFMENYSYPGYVVPIYGDHLNVYIEKVEDLCGIHDLNQRKTITIIDDKPELKGQEIFGGTGIDNYRDMIVDADKSIYIAGNSSSIDHDLTSSKGGVDIFIVKIDSSGNVIFKKTFGGTNNDYVQKMKVKANGNIVFVGHSFSNTFEGISTPDISETGLMAEITSGGDLVWVKKFGYVRADIGRFYIEEIKDLLIDANNNIFTCGSYDNYFGVRKHTSTGEIVWQNKIGINNNTYKSATAMDFDNQGNIIVTGHTTEAAPNYRGGTYDILMVKYSPNGLVLNSKHIGGSSEDRPYSLIVNEDAVYISGLTYSGDFDFPRDNFQEGQYFLYKTNFNFDSLWVKTIRKSNFPISNSLTKGPNNSVLMTANLYKNIYYGDSALHFNIDDNLTILNFNSNGERIWIKNISGPMTNYGGKVIYYKDSTYLVVASVGRDFQEGTNYGDIKSRIGKQDIWLGLLGKDFPCKNNFNQQFPQIVDEEKRYKNTVKLNNSFQPGGKYKLDAGQNIELLPGTQIDKGVTMELKIGNCNN